MSIQSRTRSFALRAALVSATVGGLLAVGATPAAALTVRGTSGNPGTASIPEILGQEYVASGRYYGAITFPYRTVNESPAYAAYDQQVCVRFNVAMTGGDVSAILQSPGWTLARSTGTCALIPAASSSTNVNGVRVDGLTGGLSSPSYGGNVEVSWFVKKVLSNGAVMWVSIGFKQYDYDAVSDYMCATARCVIGMTTWGGGAYIKFV